MDKLWLIYGLVCVARFYSHLIFIGNTIDGAGKIVRFISVQPGVIHDVRIDSNIISNMPSFDWSEGLTYFEPGIILKDKSGE